MRSDDAPLAWVAIDFLSALLLVVYVLIAPPPTPAKSSIVQEGVFLATFEWDDRLDVDVDAYVEAADGQITYFSNTAPSSLVHLERDDLGLFGDTGGGIRVRRNAERVVWRAALPGEHVVNVHCYRGCRTPVEVRVAFYSLRGTDRLRKHATVVLAREGAERTVFRVRFNHAGEVAGWSRLPKRLVGASFDQDDTGTGH